jgi:NADH:ubiquinone oxidoreductase subunit F (NADH-binding)
MTRASGASRPRARFPLVAVRERLRRGATVEAAVAATARELDLAEAPLLAAARSHADLVALPHATRVCRGTSCELAGAASVAQALASDGPVRSVCCLGHCHRSPAVLDPAGGVLVDVDPERVLADLARRAPLPAPPRIECLAPEAIVTRRIARGDFSPLAKARADGAWSALERALARGPEAVLAEVEGSALRGRGGAGFPTATKWRAAAAAKDPSKTVIANGDEGDPGSFVDRMLLERDPHGVLEGLALCAFAVGAREAVVFIRSEYPRALERTRAAVAEAERAGLLGAKLCGSGPPLSVSVVEGFGSYLCGDDSALLATLEGRRSEPRPDSAPERGLFGHPSLENNVETLMNVPWIVERGAGAFAALGTPASNGTKALCLNAGFAHPGIVEVPFGVNLRDVIQDWGATPCHPDELEGVLLGGPAGSFLAPEACDLTLCWKALAERGVRLGHGGAVAVRRGTDLAWLARHLLRFAADQSCGLCAACHGGSAEAHRLAEQDLAGNAGRIRALLATMRQASACGFGRSIPGPIETLLTRVAPM